MIEVSLTVGKLDASLALLLTKEHHLIEFPTVLLPDGVSAGSVVTIKCEQNHELELQESQKFNEVQDEILQLFGTHEPKTPVLRVKNVTQTSAVLEWDPLDLGSASIKSLTLYKNGTRLGQVPNALVNTTTKLSGLPVDTPYEFSLRLDTTAGVYVSENVQLRTHKMTDLSGITVCLGDIDPSEGITREDIEASLSAIGARPLQTEVAVDTTHFIATTGMGPQWRKAVDTNIPVVRPEWLKACENERRIVGVRNFYLDADPKFLQGHSFHKTATPEPKAVETPAEAPAETPAVVVTEETPVEPAVETTEEPAEETKEPGKETEEPTTETPTETTDSTPAEEPEAVDEPKEEPVESTIEPEASTETTETPVETTEAPTAEEFDEVDINADTEEKPAEEPVNEDVATEEPVEEPVKGEITTEEPVAEDPVTEETPVEEFVTEEKTLTEPAEATATVIEEPAAEEEATGEAEETENVSPTTSPSSQTTTSSKKNKKNKKKKGKK